jgi:AmmeMemoRadiSam system protein A
MMPETLTDDERQQLLILARQAIQQAVCGSELVMFEPDCLTPPLRQPGATFVTLTRNGELRGCVGALEAYQPLAEDVREHAVAAALNDFRFYPVQPDELPGLQIEISRLTIPQPLDYTDPVELPRRLRQGIDGVILRAGSRRSTFLPQVWEKIPDPEEFLSHLCLKMGCPANYWRRNRLQVFTYQVEEFHE